MAVTGALSVGVLLVNFAFDSRPQTRSFEIAGSTRKGITSSVATGYSNTSAFHLKAQIEINQIPEVVGIVFSTCPGRPDSLELSIDRYRNIYVTFGVRTGAGEKQVIRLLEAAPYRTTNTFDISLDFDRQSGTAIANGLSVQIADTRDGKVLDLGRAQLSVCAPAFNPGSVEDVFNGAKAEIKLQVESRSPTSSLRSFNIFFLVAILLGGISLYTSKQKAE